MQKIYYNGSYEEFINCLSGRKLYLFGSASSLEKTFEQYDIFTELEVEAVFDNNKEKWGSVCGKKKWEIISPEYISKLNKEEIVVLITSSYIEEIGEQLIDKGCKYVFSCKAICYENCFAPEIQYGPDEKILMKQVMDFLEDDKSKMIYEKILNFHEQGKKIWYEIYEKDQYFPEDIIKFEKEEIFVDAGGYIGDTVKEFITKTNAEYKKIYVFEPDKNMYARMEATCKEYDNVKCYPYGLGEREEELCFQTGVLEGGSYFTQNGDQKVLVKSLDNFIHDQVTYIKMDIEGFEMEALKGAVKTIKKYKPKLAICLYHKPSDLYEIPLYLRNIVPDYKMYIRHHSIAPFETVLYAVKE